MQRPVTDALGPILNHSGDPTPKMPLQSACNGCIEDALRLLLAMDPTMQIFCSWEFPFSGLNLIVIREQIYRRPIASEVTCWPCNRWISMTL
jgi:hypothetical protein